jgi:hypothetical protein
LITPHLFFKISDHLIKGLKFRRGCHGSNYHYRKPSVRFLGEIFCRFSCNPFPLVVKREPVTPTPNP